MKLRGVILIGAGTALLAGLFAGAISLSSGAVDQAVAFTWPGLAASICMLLAAPDDGAAS